MVKDHIKRISAPRRWAVLRKNYTFITRPNAGRDFSLCISLNTALKEMLNKTKTTKESKYLIKNKSVLVNGKPVFDDKFPVGFMDIISFPALGESYRLLVNDENKLFLLKIGSDESRLKLSKVLNKKNLSKEETQVNCSDGRNFVLKNKDPALAELKINESVLYSIPEQNIKQVLKLEKGALVYLYKGKHTGHVVRVDDFKGSNIIFKLDDEVFETKKAYAFVVGKDKPVITCTEEAGAKRLTKAERTERIDDAENTDKTDQGEGIHKK